MKITFKQKLTSEARRSMFVASGKDPGDSIAKTLEASDLTTEVRLALLDVYTQQYQYSGSIQTAVQSLDQAEKYLALEREYDLESIQPSTVGTISFDLPEGDGSITPDHMASVIQAAAALRIGINILFANAKEDRKIAAVKREENRRLQDQKETAEREARFQARKEAELAQESERTSWVKKNGSDRLKLALKLGQLDACDRIYRDERLALDRPCWGWDTEGENKDIKNPSLESLTALDMARNSYPGVEIELVYLVIRDEDEEPIEKGPVLSSHFLGSRIINKLY